MMVGSHVLIGAATWMAAQHQFDPRFGLPGYALAALGALLPDLDHPKSWIGRRVWFVSYPVSYLFGHRGFTHSLLAVLLLVTAVNAENAHGHWWVPVIIGYLSHLAADLISGGIPLFWPLRQNINIRLCRTGSWSEVVVAAIWIAALLHVYPPNFR